MTALFVIVNNYLHDVATAVLLSSAVILMVLERRAVRSHEGAVAVLREAYPALTRLAWGALIWIVVGGIPRVIFFSRYEWDPAVTGGIVPALAVKHALMFAAVVAGAVMWRRVARFVSAKEGS